MKATERELAQSFLHNALHAEKVDRIMGREPIEDFTLIELEFLRQVWVERLLACPFSAVWCVSVLPPADSLSPRALSRVWETLLDLGLLP
jgi:hypothetical protein